MQISERSPCLYNPDCFGLFPLQAEAEEDCHSDSIRADDDENESPAETDLQVCLFTVCIIFIPLLSMDKQKLVIIVKNYRFVYIEFNCISYQFIEYLSYNCVMDFFFCKKIY